MNQQNAGLTSLVDSEFFTIEMLLQYLVKHKGSAQVLPILISRLKRYDRPTLLGHLTELVFYALYFNCTDLDLFFLQLCAEDFNNFFLITNAFEIWGNQFTAQSPAFKKRIRTILEDCETSMVNGEKCLNNYKGRSQSGPADQDPGLGPGQGQDQGLGDQGVGGGGRLAAEIDQRELYDFVMGKRSKNDFKDEVRYFVGYLVKLSYLLLSEDRSKIKKIAVDFLHKLNVELYKRRSKADETM